MMRHGNDPSHSPLDKDPSSEGFEDDVNSLEDETVKTDVDREKKETFLSLGEYSRCEKESESLEHGETPVLYKDMDLDDSNIGAQNHSKQMTTTTTVSPALKLKTKQEAEFYMDKVVTEIERPKMIVCFQKDDYQVVKDICIDEGVRSCIKVSQQNDKVDHRKVYMISHSTGDECNAPTNEKPAFDCSESLYVFGNPFLETDKKSISPGSVDTKTDGGQVEEMVDHVSCEKVTVEVLLQQEFGQDKSPIDPLNTGPNTEQPKLIESDNTPAHFYDCSDGQEPANQDLPGESKETFIAASSSPDEYNEHETPLDVPLNSTSERTVINSDVDAFTSRLSEGATEPCQPEQAQVGPISGRDCTDSTMLLPRSSLVHYGHVESIMYGPGCLSDRFSYTGQMAYSGSVSIRSDSSTTSTRSFAFPILQSEWNSSPVKMAKADRKYRKHRGWRAGWLCCKF